MGYHEMEIGLKQVAAYVARWHETGRVPTIERDIVLERMQRIYAAIMQVRCTDGVAMQLAAARVEVEEMTTDGGYDGMAPDDESFEVNGGGIDYGFTAMPESVVPADSEKIDDRPAAEREDRMSQTTHTVQEVGEQDPCPSQTRFLEEREAAHPSPKPATAAAAPVAEPEPEPETTGEVQEKPIPDAEGGRSEASYLTQESGSRETYPQATEVPAMDQEGPVRNDTDETAAPKSRKPEKKKPEAPRIFGIEVSPYARHEMIDTLFHGNEAMFESECEKLDAMDSLEEALVYIGEMYRWIPENAATIKFIDLLEARFGTEEGEA
ncbi:hypothetical protein [uncultured Rikenella sp.]|uniref:hypothetical protein n=1 Tax=uncultured Rikenella sp. TaxID=368003 RepID=UPI0025CE50B6|nr:hypothetical protein [uncultured Rikenella sp.]